MITSISKGEKVRLSVSDVSGLFNKVAIIAPDSTNDFSAASDIEKANYGFITLNSGIISSNAEYRTNLIG